MEPMWVRRNGKTDMTDAFSQYHPAVNFAFFVGAIGCGVVIQHPAYLIAGVLGAATYYLLLRGVHGWKSLALLLAAFVLLAAVNPLLNTQGELILFHIFGRPYTFEALLYGVAIAGVFLVTMLWFGCYNAVMTGDKFTSLFGSLIPSVSLLLVMVLRMVPGLIRKTKQITGSRMSIGKGAGGQSSFREKLTGGLTVLGAMTSWALEGSVVTADSMRARGYGTAKRSSFRIFRMTARDGALLAVMVLLAAVVIAASTLGGARATFMPEYCIAPLTGFNAWGFAAYCVFLLLPTALHIKEAIQWHILRSKI